MRRQLEDTNQAAGSARPMSPPHKPIVDRIEKVRAAYGLSQSDFARRIGVKPHTYNGWLDGEKRPGVDTALKIRKEFHVSLDYIYAGDTSSLPVKLELAIRRGVLLADL